MRIYISGQIFGIPVSDAAAIFEAAAATIRCAGHTPISPLDFMPGQKAEEELLSCEGIYLLHNYLMNEDSRKDEVTAVANGLKVFWEGRPADFWNYVARYNEFGREELLDELECL